jgi:hypothetical protein
MSEPGPVRQFWTDLPRQYQVWVGSIILFVVSSQLGFLGYGAWYWSSISDTFSLIPNTDTCSFASLVNASQELWVLSFVAPGIATIPPALTIIYQTNNNQCHTSREYFTNQTLSDYSPLHEVWAQKLQAWQMPAEVDWRTTDTFLSWFRNRCEVPGKVISGLLAVFSVGVLLIVLLLIHFLRRPKLCPLPKSEYEAIE